MLEVLALSFYFIALGCRAFLIITTSYPVYLPTVCLAIQETGRQNGGQERRLLLIEPILLAADKERDAGKGSQSSWRIRGNKKDQNKKKGARKTAERKKHSSPSSDSSVRALESGAPSSLVYPPAGKGPMSLARLHTSTLDTPPTTPDTNHTARLTHDPRPLPRTWAVSVCSVQCAVCAACAVHLTLASPSLPWTNELTTSHKSTTKRLAAQTCATTRSCATSLLISPEHGIITQQLRPLPTTGRQICPCPIS